MANLLESYKNRLAISESYHKNFHGTAMSPAKKTMIAACLNNVSRFMNEAFDSSAATNRSALGNYKKFCLNVATTALPTLILPDLMLTQPMSSISGYVTYMNYVAGINKGGIKADETMFNSAYRLGEVTPERAAYTSEKVVETVGAGVTEITPAWTPLVEDAFKDADDNKFAVKIMRKTGKVDLVNLDEGKITGLNEGDRVAYVYNNEIIPQFANNTANEGKAYGSIPTLKAEMSVIDLHAHARRIAVYYSQIAAFQAKTDYGFDLGQQLATQAQGELAYEIDTEGVMMLVDGAEHRDENKLDFDRYETANQNTYISRSQYYEGFAEVIGRAKMVIYNRTQKYAPNYMIIGTDLVPILPYLKGWKAASAATVNGPYFAGTLDGLKVYVSPAMKPAEYVFGINGSDLQTSAAVYAPYMPIVPTQLLGFADGSMTQGFSTMYDMKLLATYNRNEKDEAVDSKEGQYSYLLVKGMLK